MSDRDTFIEEVSEEVRRDRMFALWRRYGPFALGAVGLIVIAAAAYTWLQAEEQAAAEAAGGAILTASSGDLATQAAALTELADAAERPGEALLALLRAASSRAANGETEAAIALYERIEALPEADALYRDYAAFRALMLQGEAMEPGAFADALSPLANGTGPYRLLALEARGVALHRAGDAATAVEELRAAYGDEAAPNALRQRIEAFMTAIGETLETES